MRILDFRMRALKTLKRMPTKHQEQIKRKIKELIENPIPTDSILLTEYRPHRRCDCGEYRIVYWFDEKVVHISVLAKRNDGEVYDEMKRLLKKK